MFDIFNVTSAYKPTLRSVDDKMFSSWQRTALRAMFDGIRDTMDAGNHPHTVPADHDDVRRRL